MLSERLSASWLPILALSLLARLARLAGEGEG